jgi:hypothetical protein
MARFRPTVVLTYLLKHVGRIAQLAAGVLLILAGVVGVALPILPGWALIALGIVVLAPNSRIAKWLKRAFARVRGWWGGGGEVPPEHIEENKGT